MKKSVLILLLCFIWVSVSAPFPMKRINIQEEDGSPDGYPYALKVPNDSLTDNLDGTYSLNPFSGSTGIADTYVLFSNSGVISGENNFVYDAPWHWLKLYGPGDVNYLGMRHDDAGALFAANGDFNFSPTTDFIINLGDAVGAKKFYVKDSGAAIVGTINSDGGAVFTSLGIGVDPPAEKFDIVGALHITPQASPPGTANEGDLYADTDNELYYYDGTGWRDLTAAAGGGATAYDDIGDPDAAGSISFDDNETATYTSAEDTGAFFNIALTDNDGFAGVTTGLDISMVNNDDANGYFIHCRDDTGGDNDTVFILGAGGKLTIGEGAADYILPTARGAANSVLADSGAGAGAYQFRDLATLETDPNVDTAAEILAIIDDTALNFGTGVLTATGFVGPLTGNADTCTTASAGDAALDFFGAGVTAVTDATACTDIEGTDLSIAAGTLNNGSTLTTVVGRGADLNDTNLTSAAFLYGVDNNIGIDLAGDGDVDIFSDGTITINSAYTIPLADGNAGEALVTSGAGAVSFTDLNIPDFYQYTLLPESAILDDNAPPALSIAESTGTGTPRRRIAAFATDADDIIYWTFVAPSDIDTTADWYADVLWYTNDVGPNEGVAWSTQVSATTEADADDMLEDACDTADVATEDCNETEATRLMSTTITMTNANLDGVAGGDVVTIRFFRDVSNAADDLSSDAILVAVRLRIPR